MTSVLAQAQASLSPPDFVQVRRRRINGRPLHGFVVGVSPSFVMLHRLSERLDLDGYECIRLADVTQLDRAFPRKSFYLEALRLQNCHPTVPEGLDLASTRDLLRSIEHRYPLVVISRELLVPHECEIGRIKLTSETTYAIQMLTPEAKWVLDEQVYRYDDVTRLGFDGAYENVLARVAGAAV